jgi:hypothetical protein
MLQQLLRTPTALGPAAWPHSAAARVKNCRVLSSYASKQEIAGTASGPQTGTTQQSQAGSPTQQHSRQEQLQQQWFDQSSVYYSNYPLNRAQEQRSNEEQLTQWFNAPNARVTPVLGPKVLLTPTTASTQPPASTNSTAAGATPVKHQPVWVSPAADLGAALNPSVPPLFLGEALGATCARLSAHSREPVLLARQQCSMNFSHFPQTAPVKL